MSNPDISNKGNSKDPDFLYDYGNTTIYKNQYAKNINPDGYIKIPFKISDSVANPNLVISSTNTKCETTNLYIFKNIHNIKESTESYDGELIIEHEPVTNSYEKKYVCFLLKTDTSLGKTNILDKIINDTLDTSEIVNINKLIPQGTGSITNDKANVFIFTTPIHIISNFENFKDILDSGEKKFVYSSNTFVKAVGSKGTEEGFSVMKYKEGMELVSGDDTYLECSMNGASDDTNVITTTIDSNMAKINSDNQTLYSSLNLLGIFIAILIMAPVAPFLYKITVLNLVKDVVRQDELQPGSLKTFDLILFVWVVIMTITVISGSASIQSSNGIATGTIFCIVILVSILILGFFKITKPVEFSLIKNVDIGKNVDYNFEIITQIFTKLWEQKVSSAIMIFGGLAIIPSILMTLGKFGIFNADINLSLKIAGILTGVITSLWIPIAILVSYYYAKKTI